MTLSTPSSSSTSSSSSSTFPSSSKHSGPSKKTRKGSFGQASSPSKIAEVGDFQGGYFIMPTSQPVQAPSPSSSSSYPSKPLRSSPDKRNKRYEPAQRDGVLSAKDLSMYETTTPSTTLPSSPNKTEYSPSKKNSRKSFSSKATTTPTTTTGVPSPSASVKEIITHDRWAGAAFSNAPPPSSLPLPSFPPVSSSPSSAPSSPPHVSHSLPSHVPSHPHPLYLDVQTVHYTEQATGYPMVHGAAPFPSTMSIDPYYAHHHHLRHHPSSMPVHPVPLHHPYHVPPMMASSFPPSSTPSSLPLALSLAELSTDLRRILNITEEVQPRLVPVYSS